jgi:hypothetical protein
VLTEPSVRAAVADLGLRTGHVPPTPGRALDFEKERALRALGALRGPGQGAHRPGLSRTSRCSGGARDGCGGCGGQPGWRGPSRPPGPESRCPAPGRSRPRWARPPALAAPRRRSWPPGRRRSANREPLSSPLPAATPGRRARSACG